MLSSTSMFISHCNFSLQHRFFALVHSQEMEAQGRVIPNCAYASNPFHQCTESCLKKIVEAKMQKKNSGPISIVSLLRRRKKKEGQSESFELSDSESSSKAVHPYETSSSKSLHSTKGSIEPRISGHNHLAKPYSRGMIEDSSVIIEKSHSPLPKPVSEITKPDLPKHSPKDAVLTSATQQHLIPLDARGKDVLSSAGAYFDFAFTGSIFDLSPKPIDSDGENKEPMSSGDNHKVDPYPGEMLIQDSLIIQKSHSLQSKPASYSFRPRDSAVVSANPPISKEKEDKWADASQRHIPIDAPENDAEFSAGVAMDLRFSGIVHDDDGSDGEATSISSESRVTVGKYHVEESLATTLRFIINKHGDIAANCRLESLAMRSYYLECVCFVVQTLKTTPVTLFTKSRVKELSKILKDVESAEINVAWLHGTLDEIAEDIDLVNEHTTLELAKSNCDRDLESVRKELESKLEILAQKEQEIAITKARIAETRRFVMELEWKSEELSKSMLSIMSKVENNDGISLRRVMKMI